MTVEQLQNIVTLEASSLTLIVLVILAAVKRWKAILYTSFVLATIAFYSAWAPIMATASFLVYGPAIFLFYHELENTDQAKDKRQRVMRKVCWSLLALGVATLIIKNIYNIYRYLQ